LGARAQPRISRTAIDSGSRYTSKLDTWHSTLRNWVRSAAELCESYVKRDKHDAADAEAICEGGSASIDALRTGKNGGAKSALMMHRARDLLIRQRTMLINALRGHPAEFGLIEGQDLQEIEDTQTRIAGLETQVIAWHKSNPVSQRLATIPGIGPIIATAIAATVTDPNIFHGGREFAASLGLVPRQNSSGGKSGAIHTRGNQLP
jgi:transposase